MAVMTTEQCWTIKQLAIASALEMGGSIQAAGTAFKFEAICWRCHLYECKTHAIEALWVKVASVRNVGGLSLSCFAPWQCA